MMTSGDYWIRRLAAMTEIVTAETDLSELNPTDARWLASRLEQLSTQLFHHANRQPQSET